LFHLSSPGGVASDDAAAGDRSTPDVRQVVAVRMLVAGRRGRVLDEDGRRASLQYREQSVSLGRRSVELGVGREVCVQSFNGVVHDALPRPLVDGVPGTSWLGPAVRLDDVTYGRLSGALWRSVPQPRPERTVAVVRLVHFLYARMRSQPHHPSRTDVC